MLKSFDVRGKGTIVNISHPINPDDEAAYMIVCNSNESALKFSAIRADGECIADVVSTTGNTYSYMLPKAMYAVPGVLEIRISQCSSDGSILTTKYLFFNVLCGKDAVAVPEDMTRTIINLIAKEYAERTAADAQIEDNISDKADKKDLDRIDDLEDVVIPGLLQRVIDNEEFSQALAAGKQDAINIITVGGEYGISLILMHGYEYRVAEGTPLIELMGTSAINSDTGTIFECTLIFKSGSADETGEIKPLSISYEAVSLVWFGEDVVDGVFVPLANKAYTIMFYYDGYNVVGVVGGYDI